jgi:hypothetical protein
LTKGEESDKIIKLSHESGEKRQKRGKKIKNILKNLLTNRNECDIIDKHFSLRIRKSRKEKEP